MKRLVLVVLLVLAVSVNVLAKAKEPTWLRIENLSPDSPAVDVLVNGNVVFKDVAFKKMSPYVEMPNGKYDLQFIDAGGRKDHVITDYRIKAKGGRYYTVVLFGYFKNKDVHAVELKDDPEVSTLDAKLRIVHLSSDMPSIDVYDGTGGRLFKGVDHKKPTDSINLIPDEYSFVIREKGKSDDDKVLKTDVKLEAGKNYTLFMIGDARDASVEFVSVVDAEDTGKPATTQAAVTPGKETKAERKAGKKAEKKAAKKAKKYKAGKGKKSVGRDG